MAKERTPLGLNCWDLQDIPVMDDFNRDNEIIDQIWQEIKNRLLKSRNNIEIMRRYFANGEAKHAIRSQNADFADNGITNYAFALSKADWQDSTEFALYPHMAEISIPGLKESDDAMIFFDSLSSLRAREAGMQGGMGRTKDGCIQVFAERIPVDDLAGCCTIIQREEI